MAAGGTGGRLGLVEALLKCREGIASIASPDPPLGGTGLAAAGLGSGSPAATFASLSAQAPVPAALASPTARSVPAAPQAPSYDALRKELKRMKLAAVAGEMQLCFVERCVSGGASADVGLEEPRRDARARNKAKKAAVARELAQHAELEAEVQAAEEELAKLESVISRERREVQRLSSSVAGSEQKQKPPPADADIDMGAAESAAAQAEEDTRRACAALGAGLGLSPDDLGLGSNLSGKLAEVLAACAAVEKSRHQDEALLAEVLRQQREMKARLERAERAAEEESRRVSRLEALAESESAIGLPTIHVDKKAGVMALTERVRRVDPELLKVAVALEPQTHEFLRIQAHPDLSLEKEAQATLASGDMGRLLTRMRQRAHEISSPAAAAGA